MKTFNATIREMHTWEVQIKAKNLAEAKLIAVEMDLTDEPDSVDTDSIEVIEKKDAL